MEKLKLGEVGKEKKGMKRKKKKKRKEKKRNLSTVTELESTCL